MPASPTFSAYPDSIFRLLGGSYPVNAAEVVTQLCAPSYCRPPSSPPAGRGPRPQAAAPAREGLGGVLARARREYSSLVALEPSRRLAAAGAGEEITAATTTTKPPTAAPRPTDTTRPLTLSERVARFESLFASRQPNRLRAWLDAITNSSQPALNVAHLLLPHLPWRFTGDGSQYDLPQNGDDVIGLDNQRRWASAEGVALGARRHLLQVEYVDRLLGSVIARLRATGKWDDSVLVVTADHGVGLTLNGGLRELDSRNRTEILGVPLFVRAPGMRRGIDDRPAQTVDVVPTIADLLDLTIPWRVDGRSLAGPARPRSTAHPVGLGSDRSTRVRIRRIDFRDNLARLLALARARAITATGTRPGEAVLRSGPLGDLLGRPVERLTVGSAAPDRTWKVSFPAARALRSVTPGAALPAYVVGLLDGGSETDTVVGVVNGRVAGAGRGVVRRDGDPLVMLLLDPTAFQPGTNTVTWYLATGPTTLAPLAPPS